MILPCSQRATCDDVNVMRLSALRATYHRANIQKRMIISLILWNALDAALLDVESRCESLNFRVGRVSLHECLAGNSSIAATRPSAQTVLFLHVMHGGILIAHPCAGRAKRIAKRLMMGVLLG